MGFADYLKPDISKLHDRTLSNCAYTLSISPCSQAIPGIEKQKNEGLTSGGQIVGLPGKLDYIRPHSMGPVA
ncbi:hypothetical protein FACS189472_10950 [Alphaproteobacteria bacterium]|nr:hypothetical protein FACS189472_10950 [Alphaproteobacteria bacterium]